MHFVSVDWTGAVQNLDALWQGLLAFIVWFSRVGGGAPYVVIFKAFVIYLSVGLIALIVLFASKWRGRNSSIFNLFPRSVYLHKSSWTDIFLVSISWFKPFPFAFVLAWFTTSSVLAMWQAAYPPMVARWLPLWSIASAQFLVIFIARDFAEFFRHYLAHKVDFLWALHRVHHSAEVLTPLTGIVRFHPLEYFFKALIIGSVSGVLTGTGFFILGLPADTMAVAFVLITNFLRTLAAPFTHSHIWVSFGRLDRFIQSPCMHLIHHSLLPEHRDKNMGGTLSLTIWDYLFGTLYIPRFRETFPLGISIDEVGECNPHNNLIYTLIDPLFYLMRRRPPLWKSRVRSSRVNILSDGSLTVSAAAPNTGAA